MKNFKNFSALLFISAITISSALAMEKRPLEGEETESSEAPRAKMRNTAKTPAAAIPLPAGESTDEHMVAAAASSASAASEVEEVDRSTVIARRSQDDQQLQIVLSAFAPTDSRTKAPTDLAAGPKVRLFFMDSKTGPILTQLCEEAERIPGLRKKVTPVHLAVQLLRTEFLDAALTHKDQAGNLIGLLAQDEEGETALHYAAKRGFTYAVIELLNRQPALDYVPDLAGKTASHYAVENGHVGALTAFANVYEAFGETQSGENGNTLLHWAVMQEPLNEEIIDLLAKSSQNKTIKNSAGETAFHCLCKSRRLNTAILKKFITIGYSPLETNIKKQTALHVLIEANMELRNLSELILELYQVNPTILEAKDSDDKTPLDYLDRKPGTKKLIVAIVSSKRRVLAPAVSIPRVELPVVTATPAVAPRSEHLGTDAVATPVVAPESEHHDTGTAAAPEKEESKDKAAEQKDDHCAVM